ncbi:MAG: O-antigen ligase family protein [Candidatus Moraniibacteriota bacterium]
MTYFQQLFEQVSKNTIKLYLILANVLLTVFAIWFSNVGLLPFKNLGDFAFFAVLLFLFTLYRTGWAFVFLVGFLVLENVNLAPATLGMIVRPYQLLAGLILLALGLQFLLKRKTADLPKFVWVDGLPILFAVGGFLSALGAVNKGVSFKRAVIATSFVALYFLVRIYVQNLADLKRIAPFFLSSGLVVSLYAIWQNLNPTFEVMAGRPNGSFTEPDWLGAYLVFLLATILTIIFQQNKKTQTSKGLLATSYGLLVAVFVALILTVSRSAWLGALVVVLAFLKLTLIYGEASFINNETSGFWSNILLAIKKPWHWKKFFGALGGLVLTVGLSLGIIFVFNLTSFQLGSRAQSTGGMQKITIACQGGLDKAVPAQISSVAELANYHCWHINLEDIEKEKTAGNLIQEVYRPDPNVNIRAKIYLTVFERLKQRPLLGIGWGNIANVLGQDERGAGLNASNIFLEVWLGAGLLGFLAFVFLLAYLLGLSYLKLVKSASKDSASLLVFLGLVAIIVPNLFNSGIFLGFVWVFLAIATSLLTEKEKH